MYMIFLDLGGGMYALLGTSTTTTYTDGPISPGATYLYAVRAINDVGGSDPATVTV